MCVDIFQMNCILRMVNFTVCKFYLNKKMQNPQRIIVSSNIFIQKVFKKSSDVGLPLINQEAIITTIPHIKIKKTWM